MKKMHERPLGDMERYQEILENINWPTDVVVIDFESYFDQDYTLSKMSTIEYITDKRFAFTGVSTASSPGSQPNFVPFPARRIDTLQCRHGENLERATIVAKSCKFDITILAEKFGINPPYVIDIDDLARHFDSRISHRLKDLAKLFGLTPKGDTMQFKGLHWEDMTREQKTAMEKYCNNDIDLEVELFKILLPLMTTPEIELPLARHNLNLYLIPRLKFNFFKALELSNNMGKILDEIIAPTGKTLKQIGGSLSFTKSLIDLLSAKGEYVPVKAGKPTKNMKTLLDGIPLITGPVVPAFARDDVGFQDLLAHPDKTVRELCQARVAVKSWPSHIKRIESLIRQAAASGGLLRVPYHYYGSHTGRDSGGEGINLKNLGGRGRAGKGNHPLIGKVRGLIEAPEDKVMLITDSAQIEARFLAWIAGQEDLVTGFSNNEDIYSVFATRLFKSVVRKPVDDDPDPVKEMLKIKRGFGKDAILGAGYGMGADKFFHRCMANESLRPFFDSGKYNHGFIKGLVKTYRSTYSKIPDFWRTVEKMFKWVIKYPREIVIYPLENNGLADGILYPTLLRFWNDNGTVNLQLPSGRVLYYRHCKINKDREIVWLHGHLWGGSITENIVQAACRDLLVFWILECEEAGIPVVFHCFDEIVNLIHKDDAEVGLGKVIDIMCHKPSWAEGLPLAAEGEISHVYKK